MDGKFLIYLLSMVMWVVRGNSEGDQHSYDFELVKIEPVGDSKYMEFSNLRAKRLNRTVYGIVGNISIKEDLTDDWSAEVNIYRSKLGNNQYELTPMKIPRKKSCDFMKSVYKEKMQDDFKDVSNLPYFKENEGCPFPKGTYEINGYRTDIRNFPSYMQDGTYKIETLLYKDDEKVGYTLVIKITPKIE